MKKHLAALFGAALFGFFSVFTAPVTAHLKVWMVSAATGLAIFLASASPAAAAGHACRKWDFYNQTFYIRHSNRLTVRVTFGPSSNSDTRIIFGGGGGIAYLESDGGFGHFANAAFNRQTGYIQFDLKWHSDDPSEYSNGIYSGNPTNIRVTGGGGLIADLSGRATGDTNGGVSSATWTTPDRIRCQPENAYFIKDNSQPPDPPPFQLTFPKSPEPPRPSVAHRLAFGGTWDTTMEGGFGLKLILQPQGNGISPINGGEGPLEVVGAFTFSRFGDLAADAGQNDINGTLRGVVGPHARTLVFSYHQRNGRSGGGNFTLSNDGNSITGMLENSEGKSTWNGTRAK
jgi:hypothetical protein